MLRRAVRLRDLAGIRLDIDPWLAPLVVVAVWGLARTLAPRMGVGIGLVVAFVVVLGLLASIVAHELAHALEARRRGIVVEGITLMALGGATALRDDERDARTDLAIAIVGPWTSLTLAAIAGLVATTVNQVVPPALALPIAMAAGMLGWANLVLAVTNLVPAAPLDGGRVVAALVWRWTGDRGLGLRLMGAAGILVGLALAALGVRTALTGGSLLSAVVLGLLGLFLLEAARLEVRRGRSA